MRVSPRVGHRIARDFADGDRPHVVDALSSLDLGFGNHDSDERVSVAILVLAEGSDVYPWALLGGPVLVIKLLRPRRRALELYRHPQWTAR